MRSHRVQRKMIAVAMAGVLVFAATLASLIGATTASAQPPPDPPNINQVLMTADAFYDELLAVDLDGDGVSDFDPDGDGFPAIPIGDPGDLDLRPGDGVFGQTVTASLANSIGVTPGVSIGDNSQLLFNCSGMAMSFDTNGAMVDWMIGIGSAEGGGTGGVVMDLFPTQNTGQRAATRQNPFIVRDRVVYFGLLPTAGDGPRFHTWSTETAGISIDSGGDDNPSGNNRNAGEVDISDDTPAGGFLIPSGVFPFEGRLTSQNGLRCEGQGWVKFETGNPALSAAGAAAALAGLAGVFGLLFNARPAITWRA